MKKLLATAFLVLILPGLLSAQEGPAKNVVIIPFKVTGAGDKPVYNSELAHLLGGELGREGDIRITPGGHILEALKGTKLTASRMSNLARIHEIYAVIWGELAKLPDGYSLEVSVIGSAKDAKADTFSVTGTSKEQIVDGISDLAAQIGRVVFKRPTIGEVVIDGNTRVSREAILNRMEMKPGADFRRSAVGDEIREIHSLGYFKDVAVQAKENGNGEVTLRIEVDEYPFVKKVDIEGNTVFTDNQVLDALTTKSFQVLNPQKISADIEKIKKLYEKKGYYNPKIAHEVRNLSENESNLVFEIDEGNKAYLTDIVFDGRNEVSEKELKKILPIKEKGWFWFLDDSGKFTREKLEKSRRLLEMYYREKGFIGARVGEPRWELDEGNVTVVFPIEEGDRYQIRKVGVVGDLLAPEEQLKKNLKVEPRTWFKASSVGKDIQYLTRLANNMGYARADVEPVQSINSEYKFIDMTYRIDKGPRMSINRVDIVGNERTRDKVIRRALAIGEGELYNADKLEISKSNLERMDFFEVIKIKEVPAKAEDAINLAVEVMEKKTGQISAGMGFSSQDGAMGNINLSERNFMGLGILANLKGNISARRTTYEGSLTYPWVFDTKLNTTINAHNTQMREQYYSRTSDGFGLYASYPLYGAWGLSAGFSRDSSKLSRFTSGFARSVVDYYAQYNTTAERFLDLSENSVSTSLSRDTRHGGMIPKAGSRTVLGSRFSGFGADVAFSKFWAESTYYKSLIWGSVLKIKGSSSALVEAPNEPIPFDRRILLGGVSSVRGFNYGQIGPVDRFGNIIGGDRALFANIECLVPILKSLNLNGVVFFDVGSSWNVANSPYPRDARAGAGVGVRWVSPMGPLRIDYGWKIDRRPGESPGALGFAMGQLF